MFSPQTPHFYKIILEGFLRINKLRFPRRFIRKHGNELSSQVQLRVSDGLIFQVEVAKSDGEVWFDNGWQQVCEHYSLKQGHLLLFEYEGNCSFQVVIFDMNGTEIDYPYISNLDGGSDEECQQPNNNEEESKNDNEQCQQPSNNDEEETNNDNEECQEEEEEEEEHISNNSNLDDWTDEECREEEAEELNETPKRRRKYISDSDDGSDEECQEEEEVLDDWTDEECREEEEAEELNETPPRKKYRPPKRRRKYISDSDDGSDEECQEEEDVLRRRKYISSSDDGNDEECQEEQELFNETPPKRQRKTTSDKNKNDFEDVSSSEGERQTKGKLALGTEEHSTPLQRASAFESDNPFFVAEIQASYIDPGLKMVIPGHFITKYLLKKADDVTLCTLDGKTWNARYLRYASNDKYIKAVLYDGWRKFARDNELELGDVCVFELTEQTKIILKVVIYRIREHLNCCSSSGGMNSLANCVSGSLSKQRSTNSKHLCSERRRARLTAYEKARSLQRAKDFKSENPSFKVVIQPAYIGLRWRVYIPHKFAKKYLDEKKGQVILQVSEGSTWVVKFCIIAPKSGQQKAQFCSTWKKFALDNNLEVGDVCVFELIDQNKALFKVSIF